MHSPATASPNAERVRLLLLCCKRYYDQREDDEVPDKDVIVQISQPGIEGVFRTVAKFL